MNKITKDELFNSEEFLTLGNFRKKTEHLPDSTKIVVERIHDVYFEKNNWKVFLSDSEDLLNEIEKQNPIETLSGEFILEKKELSNEFLDELKTQYIPARFAIIKDTPKIIFIEFHY